MHWFKEILICAILAEFITCMLFNIEMVPGTSLDMVVDRLLLWIWIVLIVAFVIWYLLIYDKENDKLRKG